MKYADCGGEVARFELPRLPLEIRRLVYYHYFFNNSPMSRISTEYELAGRLVAKDDATLKRDPAPRANLRSNIIAIPLLLCSSQIYNEAIDVLYRDALFYFDDMNDLRRFLDIRHSVGNAHLVRSIYFDWVGFVWLDYGPQSVVQQYLDETWHPLCRRLSGMASMRNLVVAIKPGKRLAAERKFENGGPYQLLKWLSNLHVSLEILE